MNIVGVWAKVESFSNKFFHSDWFILIMASLSLLGWTLSVWFDGAWVYFLFIMVILTIFMLCTCADSTPLFALMFFFLLSANIKEQEDMANYGWLIYPCIILVLSMIFNVIRFKPNFKDTLNPYKMRKTTFSMFLILIPMCIGGIFKWWRNASWAFIYIALFSVLCFAYVYYIAVSSSHIKDKEKVLPYVIKLMFASAIVVSLEIVIFYASLGSIEAISSSIFVKGLNLGWGSPNPVAGALVLYMPSNLYFIKKKKPYAFLFLLLLVFEFFMLITTSSRGALLFAVIGLPIILTYAYIKSDNKLQLTFTLGAVVGVSVFLFFFLYDSFFKNIVERIASYGLDDNGRMEIYEFGWFVFKWNPIFGSGWDFGVGYQHVSFSPYLFHSTIIQILACSGIVGLLGYAYYYYARYRNFFIEKSFPGFIVLAGMWIFEGYAMIDPILFFPPTFFIQLLIMAFSMDICVDDYKSFAIKPNGKLMKMIEKNSGTRGEII